MATARVPLPTVPRALEAEVSVLGGMLTDGDAAARAAGALEAWMFSELRNRQVFHAMRRLLQRGSILDPITVSEELEAAGELEEAGGMSRLAELLDATPTAANIVFHVNILLDRAERRREIDAARQVIADAEDHELELEEIRARRVQRFEEVDEDAKVGREEPPVLTGHELFSEPVIPPDWLLRGVFQRSRQGALYSRPGLGKSMLARHVSVCVGSGQSALGSLATAGGRVLWVTAEEDRDDLRRGLMMAAAGNEIDLETVLDNLSVLPLREYDFQLGDAADRAWLERVIEEVEPTLIVLDAIASLSGVDLKDDQEVMPLLRWGSRISTAHETTVLWLAHDKKDREADDLEALFGSRQNAAQMDFAYRLLPVKGSQDVLLRCTKMRGAAAPKDLTIEVVIQPDELHSMRVTTGMSRVSHRVPDTKAIKAYLEANPGTSMSRVRDTVAEELKRRPTDVGQAVHELMRQGLIENKGSSTRFKLHWVESEPCPAVSEHVPDTLRSHRVPRVPPPVGWDHGDTGHAPGALNTKTYPCSECGRHRFPKPETVCATCRREAVAS